MTQATVSILEALLQAERDHPAESLWGLRVCQVTELMPGTVYPVLIRLTRLGWVEVSEETGVHPGRPPRKYYRFTDEGRILAEASLEHRRVQRARIAGRG
jgi:DNA-binding PadR family transcriptional regulator